VNEKAEVAPGAQISASCVIGMSKIGEGSALKVSMVGDRCVIGRNVKITNSVIMDDVTIADKCVFAPHPVF
jgi:NDP-sugar pyrophosphorylase family protein